MPTTDLDELEALNNAAIETMTRLETTDRRQGTSFWESDTAKFFRPSQQNTSVPLFESSRKYDEIGAPRKYYRSSFGTNESYGYNQTADNFYRRMLVSIYKSQPPKEEEIIERRVTRIVPPENMGSMSISLGFDKPQQTYIYVDPERNTTDVTAVPGEGKSGYRPMPIVSTHASNQLAAIVMSGVLRILTTIVVNWARERSVPIEIL